MKLALTIPGIGKIDSGLPTGVPTGGLDTGNKIITVLIESAIIAALGFALYVIAHAAFNIMTSGGDKEKLAQGRARLIYAIIGLFVIFFSFFIINLLGSSFGIPLISTPTSTSTSRPLCPVACRDEAIGCSANETPLSPTNCDTMRGPVMCCISASTPPPGSIPTPIPNTSPTSGPPPGSIPTPIPNTSPTSGPTPTPIRIMPGGSVPILPIPFISNPSGKPVKRMVNLIFAGGNSANLKAEIRVSTDIGTILRIGQEFVVPHGGADIITTLTVRAGASPTCFNTITYNLFSREPGASGLPIETKVIAENFCITETLNAFFSDHRFDGKNTVFSDIQFENHAPIAQKASFGLGTCFQAADHQFFDGSKPTSLGVVRTLPPNATPIGFTMISTVPTGSAPPFNCFVTIQRVLE